jgi:hypothetical protein
VRNVNRLLVGGLKVEGVLGLAFHANCYAG